LTIVASVLAASLYVWRRSQTGLPQNRPEAVRTGDACKERSAAA
jgi:hypothetical protein